MDCIGQILSKNVLVYDLGGGTLDASLLYMSKKVVNVQGTSGDDHLGGSDFDLVVFNMLMSKCALEGDVWSHSDLMLQAEQVKIQLSTITEVVSACPNDDSKVTITRAEFDLW